MRGDLSCFQFIGFPSEWGEYTSVRQAVGTSFPIYWVPQRVGRSYDPSAEPDEKVFPIYWVPQRVGS